MVQNPNFQFRLEHVSLNAPLGFSELLHDLSFSIQVGDRVGIVGPSGAGKTSLLRLLNRLSEASAGTLYFQDQNLRQLPVRLLRHQVVLVLQESKLLGMTVQETLTYGLRLRNLSIETIQQRLDLWLEKLRIPTDWLARRDVELSVGQRQWVALARALTIQAPVLLLDEPTAALDTGRTAHFLEILHSLVEEQQTTILMVNHQLDVLQSFCSRVLYLEQGRLLDDQAAGSVDWQSLRDRMLQAEARTAAEWK
jgi:D-methionine transport system ATP-binding protein